MELHLPSFIQICSNIQWPYRFVNLSFEQTADRRRLLDLYGWYAWISPIVALSIVYSTRVLLGDGRLKPRHHLQPYYQRLSWNLNTSLSSDFGSLKIHLIGIVYLGWLLFLCIHRTEIDYMHLTKRLGHVAVSQLPFQYLLAIKSSWSPIQVATGLGHDQLNPYHRLAGRIIHLLLICHGFLYLNFFYAVSALPRRLYDRDVQGGLVSLVLLNVLAYMALPRIRRKAYHKHFYTSHVILSFLLIPAIFVHVAYTRKYIYQALILYLANAVTRALHTTSTTVTNATVTSLPGTSNTLLRVSIPLSEPLFDFSLPAWMPGQHIYLKSGQNPISPRSPFTIVSTPPRVPSPAYTDESACYGSRNPRLEFMVRNLGGPTTAWLASLISQAKMAKSKNGRNKGTATCILSEGPYGSSAVVTNLLNLIANSKLKPTDSVPRVEPIVLLLAGGIGATYTFPIYISLLESLISNPALDQTTLLHMSRNMHFHWIVRSQADAEWGMEYVRDAWSRIDRHIGEETSKTAARIGVPIAMNVTIHITRIDEPPIPTMVHLTKESEDSLDSASAARGRGSNDSGNNGNSKDRIGGCDDNKIGDDKSAMPPGVRIATYEKISNPPFPIHINAKRSNDSSNNVATRQDLRSQSFRPKLYNILDHVLSTQTQPAKSTESESQTAVAGSSSSNKKRGLEAQKSRPKSSPNTNTTPKPTLNILTCGPKSLISELRQTLEHRRTPDGTPLYLATDIRWHDEGFGMGSS